MSAQRRETRRSSVPDQFDWLRHALSTRPADRETAEQAISTLYRRLDHPPPRFVWADSPAAALDVLAPWQVDVESVESRLAALASPMRERLGHNDNPLRRKVGAVAGMIRSALTGRLGLVWFGQHDAAAVAQGGVPDFDLWAAIVRSCGWWWPRADTCVITERTSVVRTEQVDDELRLHCADGPAVVYPDGWAVHVWHGTRVPSWVIDGPTAELIAAERNVEVRRCALERFGWERFTAEANLVLVGETADPGNPGCALRLYDLPDAQWGKQSRLLLAINGSVERDGTRRNYGLRVPPWFDNPLDAAGWTYGLTGAQYALLQRRT
jgi:Domain of unknown function (DUF6745)